jgi:hypothetical protein
MRFLFIVVVVVVVVVVCQPSTIMSSACTRLSHIVNHLQPTACAARTVDVETYKAMLIQCRDELKAFINEKNCHPILIRLGTASQTHTHTLSLSRAYMQ